MAINELFLSDLAARLSGTDASLSMSLRDIVTVALQELIEAEFTVAIGAAPGERTTERLNRELKRRTDVVGFFPDKASVIRLIGALLVEINDDMIAAEGRYIAAASVADLAEQPGDPASPAAPRT
jgi:transposase-like protein